MIAAQTCLHIAQT